MRFGVFIILFLATFFTHFSQVQPQTPKTLACDLLFKKASEKYEVIFNYDSKILQNIKCLNQLPENFSEFRVYVEDYTGLTLKNTIPILGLSRKTTPIKLL